LRQARPSWLSSDPCYPSWRASSVLFSGILIRCRSLEQRPWPFLPPRRP
jgi:hypothetical protein